MVAMRENVGVSEVDREATLTTTEGQAEERDNGMYVQETAHTQG